MKKLVALFVGLFFCFGALISQAYAVDKLAYVDLSKLFSEYNKTKDYDKVLTGKENSYTTERDKKVNEIKGLKDKIDLLSDQEKQKKEPEFNNKLKALEDFSKQKEGDLRKEQEEKMKEIFQDIEKVVKEYAEKEGYTFVFNDRVLVYQNKTYDITDKILEILNKGYKK